MIEKEFNNRISTKSTAKREKYATFMLHNIIFLLNRLINDYYMGHRTKRFFQWSGKMGERF